MVVRWSVLTADNPGVPKAICLRDSSTASIRITSFPTAFTADNRTIPASASRVARSAAVVLPRAAGVLPPVVKVPFLAFDPDNPRYVAGGSYLGTIEFIDTKNNAGTNVMAAPIQYLGRDAKDMKYRYTWNAPIICSQHDPRVFYHGAQVLLRTDDLGKHWTEVSPDLTRNEKNKQGKMGVPYTNEAVGAENYGTLAYIAESPQEAGVIWTGSDDGLVYLSPVTTVKHGPM